MPTGFLSVATTTFSSITGLDFGALSSWIQVGLIQTFIGSMLGLVQGLLPWILVGVFIAACLSVAFAAFRFFHH